MKEYRVTKYNPRFRMPSGEYARDEWMRFADIGQSFDGVELTRAEYEHVEDAYVIAATEFLREAEILHLAVRGLENSSGLDLSLAEGDVLSVARVSEAVRELLREEFWCRLEGSDAFVHIGYDYYMYIGVPHSCSRARRKAQDLGLL